MSDTPDLGAVGSILVGFGWPPEVVERVVGIPLPSNALDHLLSMTEAERLRLYEIATRSEQNVEVLAAYLQYLLTRFSGS